MLFYLIAITVTLVDQLSKIWIRIHLRVGESMPVWENILNFTHYENSGAAASSFQGYARYFVIPAIALVAVVLYNRSKGKLKGIILELGTAFLVGGAIGNAIDRILFSKVTDFIDFEHGHGILNIADFAINLGVLLILTDTFLKVRFKANPKISSN